MKTSIILACALLLTSAAPAYELLDNNLVERWRQYVQQGGHLVLTARTGQKDRTDKLWEAPWAGPILDLIGPKYRCTTCCPSP
jgi:beta-galactosidase